MRNERAWSVAQLSDELGNHEVTIRRWIRQGSVPAIRIGRGYRIPHQAAVALVEGQPLEKQQDNQENG